MSRLHFKGGPWANAEDEVLKAGLAQYGLRDWERVASMLTKKTGAQCRERWENYLDPRLNIHEAWSLEEEEKLVELQSLFPNKFRLISEQLTRRTPNHYIRPPWLCEQRYLELKDEQEYYAKQQQQQQEQQGENGANAAAPPEKQSLEAFMAERRRRRNARKTHEERAAKADTISGERFESEMIAMATSRLANQDQKKGLRKERQRQLDEAGFLAKLESNREGIESGTLSLRQSKKMRKALDEDRQETGLVDLVDEDDEVEGGDGGEGMAHSDSGDGEDEEGIGHGHFKAIDMYEDQQQAGLVKKQRLLMKDLTEQQRMIQQRQMLSGEGGGEGDGTSNRARAALTGVNQDLLKQLTAAPASGATASTVPLVRDRAPRTPDATSGTELHNTLADLFAALPGATTAATISSSSDNNKTQHPIESMLPPPPPLKRPREALSSTKEKEGDDASGKRAVLTVQPPSDPSAPTNTAAASPDVFSALDLPAPRKQPKREKHAEPAPPSSLTKGKEETPLHHAMPDIEAASSSFAGLHDAPRPPARQPSFDTPEEAASYRRRAQQLVAVACEQLALSAATTITATPATPVSSLAPLTDAESRAVQDLIDEEQKRGREEGATAEAMVEAVRVHAADTAGYTSHVESQAALHQLSQLVAAQVREANTQILEPVRQEWEQIVAVAMLDPRQSHVMHGYVRDDGRLKQPSSTVSDGAQLPSVAAYVYERLAGRLMRAQQATRFVRSLRDREQLKMRRDLDDAAFGLQQLQAREKTLQDMYRHKRAPT